MKYKINTISFKNVEMLERFLEGNLKEYIPKTKLTKIRENALDSGLENILIQNSVIYIGKNSLSNASNIYYDGSINDWCNIEFGGIWTGATFFRPFYIMDDKGTVNFNGNTYSKVDGEVTISSENINAYCFNEFPEISKLILTKDVKNIGVYAFRNCRYLSEIIYNGTLNEWALVNKDKYWTGEPSLNAGTTPARVVKCTDGEVSVWA